MLIARRRAISTAGRPRAASQKVAIGSRMQKAHSPTIATSSRVWSGVCVDSGFEGSWRAMPASPTTTMAVVIKRLSQVPSGTKVFRNISRP